MKILTGATSGKESFFYIYFMIQLYINTFLQEPKTKK